MSRNATDLTGKVALVTGSSRGIGMAIAVRYAQLGADIVLNSRGEDAADRPTPDEIRRFGGRVLTVTADLTRVSEIDRLFSETLDHFGRVDIVVVNAGVEIVDQAIDEVTEEHYDRLYEINGKGTFFTLQRAARHVSDNGRIIYIGSSTTCMPFPGVGLYGSSKMAARYVVEVLAQEVGRRGVTVNSILPTAIAGAGVFTDISDDHPMQRSMATFRPIGGRMGLPSDAADAAEYFAGDLAGWVSGQHLLVSGGARG